MKLLARIIFVYNFLLVSSLIIWGVRSIPTAKVNDLFLLLLLLPVFFYFLLKKAWLKHISFIFVLILFLTAVFSTAILTDWFFALLLLPLVAYFLMKTPLKVALSEAPYQTVRGEVEGDSSDGEEIAAIGIKDIHRRDFLKFIGGAGLGFILASLLNPKQAGAAFFGSVPGPGTINLKNVAGTQINPATEDKQDEVITELQVINSLAPSSYDYISLSYTGSNLTGVIFKTGGSGGTAISTLTLTYDDANNLTGVTKT